MLELEKIRNLQKEKEFDKMIEEAARYLESHSYGSGIQDSYISEVHTRLAECYLERGELDLAEEKVKIVFGSPDENNPYALITAARIYIKRFELKGKLDYLISAQTYIEKSLGIDPDHPHANALAAEVYFYQRNKERATKLIEKALKVEPREENFKIVAEKIKLLP